MRRDGGLRRRLLVGLGTLTVLFLAVLGTMLFAVHELRATDRAAQRTSEVVVPTSRAQTELTKLETAMRDRVEQRTPGSARALDRSIAEVLGALRRVELAVADRDDTVAGLIRAEVAAARSFIADVVEPISADPSASLGDGSRLSRAERQSEQIALRLNQLVERGRATLLPRRERTAHLAQLAEIVGVAGIVFTLLLLGGCLLYFRRSVLDPMGNVAAAARAIAEGDLQARVRGDDAIGSGEVASLAQTFNLMADSLEENRAALQRQNAELESRGAELVDAVRSAREGASVLRAVLDATPDAIALLDREGGPIVDNPPMRAVRAAFGARATAIDQDGTLVPLDAGDGSGEVRDEITLLGTRRAFARYATPVRDGHGRLIGRLLVLREVTREREAERVKEEFFALVSHELRTPLTAILGYVELVLGEHAEAGTDADEERRHLEIVERNAQRLLRLVGDLLFAAQVESDSLLLEPGIVDLARIAHEAVEAARPRAEDAGILLSAQIDPLPAAVGDRDRLAQVLDNLISNALKFTTAGGHVEVRLSRAGDEARLDVADTGVGVPRGEQSRLFDRFFRASNATSRAVPGVGLGLMIVHAIVAAHGGTITLASEIGEGSTFTVRLPLQTAEVRDRDAAGGPGAIGGIGSYSTGGR
ncbi:ATP-binding protein [Conexibacter sp. JD483]|uniref:sensor histidine kinase n=1 Tax=unclassified Conexibacter TaxID=2627773 RepID=UPI0027182BB5|nr:MULTISPECIES: ATP-binding protein [unclassified Conexibacter]MDO8184158.1 ATP-binding protein [Conexibacter sp. CPCC 205706]MDO8197150.1 ATP-binding protein [Conexibacter sp. CPCC 205762]MDR9367535.1 ATP-binding protein [Conexibacter sp. JD483]